MAMFQLPFLETKLDPCGNLWHCKATRVLGQSFAHTMLSCSRQVEEALFCGVPHGGAGGPRAAGGAVRLGGHARAGARVLVV